MISCTIFQCEGDGAWKAHCYVYFFEMNDSLDEVDLVLLSIHLVGKFKIYLD
jgi:hypothetical protein